MANNIIWHKNKVSFQRRCEILSQIGVVIWFTGISGSGKSTIAVEVERELVKRGKAVYLLDGDNIRTGINSDIGFSDKDRNENIRRISEIAALFKDAGIITLVSFISPFLKMREFAKDRVEKDYFLEIYVKAGLETCKKRDPKGLYKKKIDDFTGITSVYEEPENPDLVLDTEKLTMEQCCNVTVKKIIKMQDMLGGK